MPNFDHSGPEGMGSRSGRGMGQCMNRGGKGRMAMQGGMGNTADPAQTPAPGKGQNMGQNMRQNMSQNMGPDAGQGRCCRHGQRQNNRNRNCGMKAQGAGMGRGQGMQKGQGMGRGMVANQPETCGTPPAAGSDGADNNS